MPRRHDSAGRHPLLFAWKCTGWSIPAANPPTPLHAPDAPAALIVNSTLDQATSILDAQHVADQITGSAVLPVDGMSHASYWFGAENRCLRDAVHRYLLDATMPPPGLSCQASVPPPR